MGFPFRVLLHKHIKLLKKNKNKVIKKWERFLCSASLKHKPTVSSCTQAKIAILPLFKFFLIPFIGMIMLILL